MIFCGDSCGVSKHWTGLENRIDAPLVMYEAGLEIGSFLDIVCSEAYVYKQTR